MVIIARFACYFCGIFTPLFNHLPINGMMIGLSTNSKKQLLKHILAHADSLTKVTARAVYDALIKRERLVSTSISGGVIITTLEMAFSMNACKKTGQYCLQNTWP